MSYDWKKSTRSQSTANCVEVKKLESGTVLVRNTRDNGQGPQLIFTGDEFAAFLAGAQDGEFD